MRVSKRRGRSCLGLSTVGPARHFHSELIDSAHFGEKRPSGTPQEQKRSLSKKPRRLDFLTDCCAEPEKETTITKKNMITKKKEMSISQTNRADSAPQEPQSALRGLMQRLGLTLLASTLTIGATEAQQVAPPIAGVIGKVHSFTGGSLDVQTPSGVVHVDVKQPLTTYKQIPSDLSHVTSTSYVGVASTEQAAGKEVAKQIIIFPPELSGAAEGSVLTDPPGANTHSRMTNGSVSRPAVSHSHMTNGTVQKGSGTTLVVQYQDGSKTILRACKCPSGESHTRTSHIR